MNYINIHVKKLCDFADINLGIGENESRVGKTLKLSHLEPVELKQEYKNIKQGDVIQKCEERTSVYNMGKIKTKSLILLEVNQVYKRLNLWTESKGSNRISSSSKRQTVINIQTQQIILSGT